MLECGDGLGCRRASRRRGIQKGYQANHSFVKMIRSHLRAGACVGPQPRRRASSTQRAVGWLRARPRSLLAVELATLAGGGYLAWLLATSDAHRAKMARASPAALRAFDRATRDALAAAEAVGLDVGPVRARLSTAEVSGGPGGPTGGAASSS